MLLPESVTYSQVQGCGGEREKREKLYPCPPTSTAPGTALNCFCALCFAVISAATRAANIPFTILAPGSVTAPAALLTTFLEAIFSSQSKLLALQRLGILSSSDNLTAARNCWLQKLQVVE